MPRKTMLRKSMRKKTAKHGAKCSNKRYTRKRGGGKKGNKWTEFTKKVYHEMKRKDSNVEFRDALMEASKRKARGEYH